MNEITTQTISTIIVGLDMQQPDFTYTMTELGELVAAAGMTVVGQMTQRSDRPDPATYFGKGKVEEIAERARATDAPIVVVNSDLSPSQTRNLEKAMKLSVMDRTELILRIFASRARSREAKLQVGIAKEEYALPRIHPSSNPLDQQGGGRGNSGGATANRGTGETQLELDKRVIKKRITHMRHELKEIMRAQDTRRDRRIHQALPSVALVGYTNAGKSTTMNSMLQQFGLADKQVFVKNQLFATLDTSVRKIQLPTNRHFLLSDTVGFVSHLPHHLVESFKATLKEAADADLLIQVVDFADPHYKEMMETTEQTLDAIGVKNIPMLTVYNKADLRPDTHYPDREGNTLTLSATDPKSIQMLADTLDELLFKDYQDTTLLVPFTKGDIVNYLRDNTEVKNEHYTDEGTAITTILGPIDRSKFAAYIQTNPVPTKA
ncbi:GTPase HflX [Schleiferilactobacillus perolens]|uniref:GTPase HflX n=1 Tax=Schleiferilactobacillus perolens DSM 12744 TaxID=1423792 RepID=A0A0R1MTD0_9LACO|nr:GTPase HflX [Schleiferilactobacillus perolens]KRL10777.1 HflX subfamily GTP-binding protein [Schleiferilactobacillus perolens DSM 12744]